MINVRRVLYEAWTVGCCDANTVDLGTWMREFAEAIKSKCGRDPYRLYAAPATLAALESAGLTRGWETMEIPEIKAGSMLLAAGGDPQEIGRLTVFNMKGLL